MKILYFTETLFYGGKERRLLELIQYFKENTDHSMALVVTENEIQYQFVYELDIPIIILTRKWTKYDPFLFIKFYKFCRNFKPDIIHSWGRLSTFYSIPSKLIRNIPLVSSMIADADRKYGNFSIKNVFFLTDIFFSNKILSNSKAGLKAYDVVSSKAKVIWNGVNLNRFKKEFFNDKVREEFEIKTEFLVVMVASFTFYKDYNLFLDIAKEIRKTRSDVTFVAVGDGPGLEGIQKRIREEQIDRVILTGSQKEVERIVSASDIGLLCTYTEGISNSIIEYMALGKPVITTDLTGGSKEIVLEGETGYCIERNCQKVAASINFLLNNPEIRISMGNKGKERISTYFSINRMGEEFEDVYKEVLTKKRDRSKL
jgi:glycosyltransferase involved in cell wall biosynthesis